MHVTLNAVVNLPSDIGLVVWICLLTEPEERRCSTSLFDPLFHEYDNPVCKRKKCKAECHTHISVEL